MGPGFILSIGSKGADVAVRGWADTEIYYDWTEKYSDHAFLCCEVEVT